MEGVRRAHKATEILFGGEGLSPRAEEVVTALEGDPRLVFCERAKVIDEPITKVASTFGLVGSRGKSLSGRNYFM